MAALIGKKLGMTQLFSDNGAAVPVTVIEAGPCPVVQIRTPEDGGYAAVQLGFGEQKDKNASKAERGHAAKASLEHAPELLKEYKVADASAYEIGQQLTVEQFQPGDRIKVIGKTKGRGFQGVVKRHGFGGRPGSHGHPRSRTPGSIGPGTNPSRVIKGKKMPGQYGDEQQTMLNVRVEKVDPERNLIYIRGGVPGARNSVLYIKKA
jgi:large subunit ribosomal protein L3